jgi:hypothetical protein
VNRTPQELKRYNVEGRDCYLATDAARLLGVHRKTITRRQASGRYTRLTYFNSVAVPVEEIHAELTSHLESEAGTDD